MVFSQTDVGCNFIGHTMKILTTFIFLTISYSVCSQGYIPKNEIDTSLSFWGTTPINMGEYENRVVPYGSVLPIYVCINYKGGKSKNKEYFKIDSTHYLMYDYFENGADKAQGTVEIRDEIIGKSYTRVRHGGIDTPKTTLDTHYYKKLSKEGEWTEYVDTFEFRTSWFGQYKDDKKIGIWKYSIVRLGEDLPICEINYTVDSTKKLYKTNIAFTIPLDSLQSLITDYWLLRSCDSKNDTRMVFSKLNPINDSYRSTSNPQGYYSFKEKSIFKRLRGDGCYKFKETSLSGKWILTNEKDSRQIKIKFTDNTSWTLKILYLDVDGNLVTERN